MAERPVYRGLFAAGPAAPRVCPERIDIDNKFRQAIYFSINSRI
ncbi:hypothetical protein HMPREF3197_01159 [Klebsiella pneumoniae]|nr:hypothetical protein HMPREF3197_01159 [Klebsiella pneumoniae]